MSLKPLATIFGIFLIACNGQQNSFDLAPAFVDRQKIFTREIPQYKTGKLNVFYLAVKSRQQQIKLDRIENGFENLQIRIWTEFAFQQNQKLTVITNKGMEWKAAVYNLSVSWDGEKETTLVKRLALSIPKSGWKMFSEKLLSLNVVTLPNSDVIPGLFGVNDGNTYCIEIATKNRYRFYYYTNPEMFKDDYWQAKNMDDIIKLLAIELAN